MAGVTEGCEIEPGAGRPEPGASTFPAVAAEPGRHCDRPHVGARRV